MYSQGNIEFDFVNKRLSNVSYYPNFKLYKNKEYNFTINNINRIAYKMSVNIGDDSFESSTDIISKLISDLNAGLGVISGLTSKSVGEFNQTEKFGGGKNNEDKIKSFRKYLALLDSIDVLKTQLVKSKKTRKIIIDTFDLLSPWITYEIVSSIDQSDIQNAKIGSDMTNVVSALINFIESLELEQDLIEQKEEEMLIDALIEAILEDREVINSDLLNFEVFNFKMLTYQTYNELDSYRRILNIQGIIDRITNHKSSFFTLMQIFRENKLGEDSTGNGILAEELSKQIQVMDTLILQMYHILSIDDSYFVFSLPIIPNGNYLSIDLGFDPKPSSIAGITASNRYSYNKLYKIPVIGSSRSFMNLSLGFSNIKNSNLIFDIDSRLRKKDNTDSIVFYKLSKDSGTKIVPILSSNIYHLWRVGKNIEIGPSIGVSVLLNDKKFNLSYNGGFSMNLVERLNLNFGVLIYNQRIVRYGLNYQNYSGINPKPEINDDFFITKWTPSFMFSIGYSIPLYKTTQSIKINN